MATLCLSIACLALANAARLTLVKVAVRTARIVRKGAARVRCTFAA